MNFCYCSPYFPWYITENEIYVQIVQVFKIFSTVLWAPEKFQERRCLQFAVSQVCVNHEQFARL
jgi:hypothetical protein